MIRDPQHMAGVKQSYSNWLLFAELEEHTEWVTAIGFILTAGMWVPVGKPPAQQRLRDQRLIKVVWSGKMEIPAWKGKQLLILFCFQASIQQITSQYEFHTSSHRGCMRHQDVWDGCIDTWMYETSDYGIKWNWGHLRDMKINCPLLSPGSLALSFSNLLSRMLFYPKLQLHGDVIPEGMPLSLPVTTALQHVQESCQWVLQSCEAPPDFFLELLRYKPALSCTKRSVNPPFPQPNTKLYFF